MTWKIWSFFSGRRAKVYLKGPGLTGNPGFDYIDWPLPVGFYAMAIDSQSSISDEKWPEKETGKSQGI